MKSLSSNLLKGNWVQFQNSDARVIDSNSLLERRLQSIGMESLLYGENAEAEGAERESSGGFQSGLAVTELEGLVFDPDDPLAVIKADSLDVQEEPAEPVYEGPSPEELLAQAEEEIRQMKEAAYAEIEESKVAILDQARQEGYQQGHDQGYQDGFSGAKAEIEEAKRQQEEEYQQRLAEMEPELVRHLTDIYNHVFHVEFDEHQGLILQLLEGCIQKTDSSKDYIIHVCSEVYSTVSAQKNRLQDLISRNSTVEIIEDITLKPNECMIETDGGIYDCSLDVQLSALQKELRLLSYEGGAE